MVTPTPAGAVELLTTLEHAGVRLTVTPTGRLRTTAPPGAITPTLAAAIRAHHNLLAWTVTARTTGHAWAPCTNCGQPILIAVTPRLAGRTVWPTCHLTPGCTGRHTTQPEP